MLIESLWQPFDGRTSIEAARLALASGFRNPDEMRRSPLGFVLALAKVRLADRLSADAEEWKPPSTAVKNSETVPEVYYPPEELKRQRVNSMRATSTRRRTLQLSWKKQKGAENGATLDNDAHILC